MPTASAPDEQRAEAARYALLRRLAYAMRHHMVVHLQPIGMIIDVMERRLAAPAPDFAQVQQAMAKVNTHSRAAVQSSLDVVSWLAPEDGSLIAAGAGVQECFELLRSQLNFFGFTLRNDTGSLEAEVSRPAMRALLPAVLLALSDESAPPAELALHGESLRGHVRVTVVRRATQGEPGYGGEPGYRAIGWDDVAVLARSEGVGCERDGNTVTLAFPA